MIRAAVALAGAMLVQAASPPAPTGAIPWQGPFETAAYVCGTEITNAMKLDLDHLHVTSWRVPAAMTWAAIVAHYQAALPGWTELPVTAAGTAGCKLHAWRNGGLTFAAGLLDEPVPGPGGGASKLMWAIQPGP